MADHGAVLTITLKLKFSGCVRNLTQNLSYTNVVFISRALAGSKYTQSSGVKYFNYKEDVGVQSSQSRKMEFRVSVLAK